MATRYAEIVDLQRQGLPPATLEGFSNDVMNAALDARSAYLDGFLSQRWTLPLTVWDLAVRACVVHLASWDLIIERGYVPNNAWDEGVRLRAEAADRWAMQVARGNITPAVTDSTPLVTETRGPSIAYRARRGW